MAGEVPQETGQAHGQGCVCLKEREGLCLRGANQNKKPTTGVNSRQEKRKQETDYSAEANFYIQFSTFRYERPNLDFTSILGILSNLTIWGRVRSEFSPRLSYEVFKDFYFGLNAFVKYDSRPPTVEAP